MTVTSEAGPRTLEEVEPAWCVVCGLLPVYAVERCRGCYRYWRRTGEDRPESLIARARGRLQALDPESTLVRFASKVLRGFPSGCWIWAGAMDRHGYGRFHDGVQAVPAHRFAYEVRHGAAPPGLRVVHRCRVPLCVNPDHLQSERRKNDD